MQTQESAEDDHDDSGEESDGEDDEVDRGLSDDEEEDEHDEMESPTGERPPSPDTLVVLNNPERLGPSEEDEAEFEKELAKLVTETGAGIRKADKRNAQGLRDTAVVPAGMRKKKTDESEGEGDSEDVFGSDGQSTMKFMLLTKKGNKQQVGVSLIFVRTGLICCDQDKEDCNSNIFSSGHPDFDCTDARQSRARTTQTSGIELRAARRS